MARGCNCEKCQKLREYRRKYAEENKERLQAYQREYYQKNREKLLKRHNDWNEAHREETRAKYKPHPRKLKEGSAYESKRKNNKKRYADMAAAVEALQEVAEMIERDEAISKAQFEELRKKWRSCISRRSQKLKKATTSGHGETAPNSTNEAGATQSERPDLNAAANT